jgi:hypothetical protein
LKREAEVRFKRSLTSTTLAVAALPFVTIAVAACNGAYSADWMPTSSTATLPASYPSFRRELSGAGYHLGMVQTVPDGDTKVMEVWVWVDPAKETQAAFDAVFDHAVALAKKYGIADSMGGRLKVVLFDAAPGQLIHDHIIESRDFSLAGGGG